MSKKDKLGKVLNKEVYEDCLRIKELIDEGIHEEFVYDLDVFAYIELYQTLSTDEEAKCCKKKVTQ